jgi:alpha-1,6-mannosyltransferase
MKICDLTQSYSATGGGIRTYIHAKRDYLLEQTSHEHLLIVPGAEDRVEREGRRIVCTVASPPLPGTTGYRLLYRADRVLRLLRNEAPDVVEVHCPYVLPWTAYRYRRESKCAVVGAYMTDFPSAYAEPAMRALLGERVGAFARRMAERYVYALYNRADATLAISPAFVEQLQNMGVRNARLIPLGVDLDTFHPRRANGMRRRLGIGADELVLIYAGRLDREKRADMLVRAFERLPDDVPARLLLVGEGPLRAKLLAKSRDHARVHVLPFQGDRDALAGLLASADIYVTAMPYETFGLSVIEAQACGLPVVGVDGGAMRDRVCDDVGVLGAVDAPEDMARNIVSLYRNGFREKGLRARKLVESEFSWARTFDALLDLYRELREEAPERR